MALSSDGSLAMTAERGQQPRAHVWDALSGKDLAVLPVAHRGDIKYLAFAPDGKSAVSLGLEGREREGGREQAAVEGHD